MSVSFVQNGLLVQMLERKVWSMPFCVEIISQPHHSCFYSHVSWLLLLLFFFNQCSSWEKGTQAKFNINTKMDSVRALVWVDYMNVFNSDQSDYILLIRLYVIIWGASTLPLKLDFGQNIAGQSLIIAGKICQYIWMYCKLYSPQGSILLMHK